MKLLFVGYFQGFGGAERMLIMLSNAMAERGHDVRIVGLAGGTLNYEIKRTVKYRVFNDKSKSRIKNIYSRYRNLKREIKNYNPDIILHFWMQSAYMCAFMGKDIARKTIYSERGDPYDKEYTGIKSVLRNYTFHRIRGFVFQTVGAQNFFSNDIRQRSCIICNPCYVNTDGKIPAEEREKRIVTIGRLTEQKNQSLLIDAIAKLPLSLADYKVEIYGEGELKEKLEKKIESLKLTKQIELMGTFSDIHSKIRKAALFVLTSNYEGMPNALLEAMALGIPCISTDCSPGGAREIITDHEDGIIVPCNDSDALSKAIQEVLEHEKIARRLCKKAVKNMERFNPDVIYAKWESFFLKVLSNEV